MLMRGFHAKDSRLHVSGTVLLCDSGACFVELAEQDFPTAPLPSDRTIMFHWSNEFRSWLPPTSARNYRSLFGVRELVSHWSGSGVLYVPAAMMTSLLAPLHALQVGAILALYRPWRTEYRERQQGVENEYLPGTWTEGELLNAPTKMRETDPKWASGTLRVRVDDAVAHFYLPGVRYEERIPLVTGWASAGVVEKTPARGRRKRYRVQATYEISLVPRILDQIALLGGLPSDVGGRMPLVLRQLVAGFLTGSEQ